MIMGAVLNFSVNLQTFGPCYKCGIEFAGPSDFVTGKMQKGGDFFCPNGHSQHYTETENTKLTKQLEAEKQRREWAEKNAADARERAETARKAEAIVRGKLRAQTERVKNGVCPCCNRTFQNLMRHMKTKHPEWKT